MSVISVNNITKEFQSRSFSKDKIIALNNFSLNVEKGEIFGILGPNGAGKTTLIKILLGIVFPTKGDATVFDKSIRDESYKKKIGYLPENHKFPNYMNGEQVLHYFGMLSGMSKNDAVSKTDMYLKMVGMDKWKKIKIKKYSKGMMQRLGLAQALMNNPDLVFLDEPTDGVDPIGRKEIRDILINFKTEGKTIFLNSHLLSEVELICDRVAILNKGQLIKEGKVEEITAVSNNYRFITSPMDQELINIILNQFRAVIHSEKEFFYPASSIEELNMLIDFLRSKKILIQSVSKERDTLENLFINLVGEQNQ
jgi:ABC-2 type transport system ATP-binding protein